MLTSDEITPATTHEITNTTLFPELIEEWDYERNKNKKHEMFTKGSQVKVWWKCEKGHSWRTTIRSRACGGSRCPYCRKSKNN